MHESRLDRRVPLERAAQLTEHLAMSANVHSLPNERGSVTPVAALLAGVSASHTLSQNGQLELRRTAV
jgi:hypothetical protein